MTDWEIEVNESVQERVERDGWDSLSQPEQMYHAVWDLLFVAYGPGFDQYFVYTPPYETQAARDGLQAIGAKGMLAIFDEARDRLPWKEAPEDEETRATLFREMADADADKLSEACDRFTDQPYPEDLLQAYVSKNEAFFTGPRTALDLWTSKVARGVDTTPRYVSKVMDFEKEAQVDRPFSSRSCPNCGYPTPDYRPRCKRCDYPHGRA